MHRVPCFFRVTAAVAALLGLATSPAHSEVAAVYPNGALSVVSIITDDPEPVGVWDQYHPTGGSHIVLNPDGAANGDGNPSLIMSSAPGFPMAAWAKHTPQGYDIVISRFDGGAWTEPQVVAGTPANELDPFLVRDPGDGSIHVVYWVHDATPRVLHRQAPADLSSWCEGDEVSHPGDIACRPSAAFHGGVLRVAYELHDLGLESTPRQIVLATRDGSTFLSEILATTQYAGPNWPIVHSAAGKLWVDWIDTACEMSWRLATPAGGFTPVENQCYQSAEERDFHVRGLIRKLALE